MSHNIRPAQLTLTPHHLFYILSRLEELDISIGPMNIRLENIHTETSPANYVSFLHQPQSMQRRGDKESIHSVSSVRSVMSGMGALWSSFGLGGGSGSVARSEKAKAALEADLKYLYSAFTKLPSLRLSPDHRARLIRGYEEFPFDTAVPLFAFKNLQSLDIIDMDFRQFYGWDRLAEQLRLLTVKRANLEDPRDLITNIVLDDADKRRFRSTRTQHSSTLAWSVPSPTKGAVCRSNSEPGSPGRLPTLSPTLLAIDGEVKCGESPPRFPNGSVSPVRPLPTRPSSSYRHIRSYSSKAKRSGSGSSNSSEHSLQQNEIVFGSLSPGSLPASKWRFLKYLSLADNSLTSISSSSLLPLANSLRSLNLSSNLFTEIPDSLSTLTRLTSLDLSNCMIESLHSLSKSPLPAITTLKLRYNRLTSLAGIERLLSLENLNVQDNKISDPMEAARLTGLPNMHRIYVKRNPLTRQTDYRIKIFNLFRNTPGYFEDVIVDESSPGYAERKLLQDRVPESERPPVIRPVEVIQLSPPSNTQGENHFVLSSPPDDAIEKHQMEHTITSTRRRKFPRRRIVDLSREEEQGSGLPSADLKTFGPLFGNSAAGESVCAPAEQANTLGVSNITSETWTTMDTSEDDFRKRIEALKLEVGDRWLSVLRDQGLEGSADRVLNGNVGGRLMSQMQGQNRQVLVSGGRTLG